MTERSERLCRELLLCCGGVGILAATWLGYGALGHSGRALVLFGLLVIWCAGAAGLYVRPVLKIEVNTVCALVGLYLCLCLRMALFDYISPDYVSFLGPWTETMRHMGIRQVLTTPIGDYNMPYLYLLLLISRLPFYDLYCIKLISVLADVLLAVGAARLSALRQRRDGQTLAVFFGVLLAPTVVLNSAYWGQCDGVYACFALWGLYLGLRERPVWSMVLFACAFAFKLQSIFLMPVIAFLLVHDKLQWRHLLAFPAAFLALMLPALLAGRSFSDTFSIYVNQTNAYPYLTLKAPTLWALIPNDYFGNLSAATVILAGIGTLLLLYVFLRHFNVMSTDQLISMGLLFSLAIPWLLPRMHERYFYLAEVLSIVYAARSFRRLPVAVVLVGGGFLAYSSYLFGGMPILSTELLGAIYGLTLLYLIVSLLRRSGAPYTPSIKGGNSHEQA